MHHFAQWLSTPLGRYLIQREQVYFDQEVADIFGFNAIQLGLLEYDLLKNNRIPMRLRVGRESGVGLRADPLFLPVKSQSIDLVLLPHVLEFSAHPHRILREAERILIPEGQLIISGFNPFSLWGIARYLPALAQALPQNRQFISLPRIKDWLELLGFEAVAGRMCCYVPSVQNEALLSRFRFMEAAGNRWWALAGGVYFLRVRKRVHGMRLITPTWHERHATPEALKPVAPKLINRNKP